MPSFTIFKPPFSDYRLILQKPYTLLKFSSIWLNSKLSSNPFREIRLEILSIYAIYLLMDFFVGNGLRSNSLVLILVSLTLILDNGMQKLAKFAAPMLTGLLFAFSFDTSYTCSLKFYTAQIVLIATNNMLIALPFQIISSIQAFYIGDYHCPFNSFHHSLLCFMLLAQIRKLSLTNSAKIEAFRAQNELLKAQLQNQETKLKEDKILYQDLIALLSLDFKASVENIMGKIKLLQKAATESTQNKENLQTARLNCETSLNLLKNIQDYSKVEAEDIDIHCVSANIRKSLEKTWSVCKEILKEKGLTGDILLHKNTPTLLMADPHRIHQILINLVQNSIKSTRKDFVRIIVSWFPIESSPPELNLNRTLSAKDNSLALTKSVSKPELGENVSGKKELDLLHVSRANVPSSCVANYFQLNVKTGRFPSGHHQKLYNTFDHYQGFLKIQVLDYGKDVSEHILEDLSQPASRFTHENSQSIENKNIRLWATRKICQKMEGDLQVFHGVNNVSSSLAIIQAEISPQSIGTPTPSPSKPIDNKPSIVSMRNMGFMTLANSTQHLKPVDTNRISGTEKKEEVKLRAMIANNVCYEQQLSKHYLEICGVEIKFETKNCQDACNELIGNKEKMYDLLFMNIDMDSAEGKSSCIKIRDYERKHKMESVTIVILARDCDDNDLRYYLDQNGPIHADYLYKQPLTLKECQNLTRLVRKGKLKKKSHIERALDAFSSKALVYEKDIFQQVLLENYLKMGQIKYKTLSKEGVQKTFFMNPETVSAILYNCETDENECESFAKAIQSFIERRNLWKIPLIGIIGQKQIPKMEALRAAGFKDFLIKPFDYENVVKMLESPFMQDP